MLICPRTEHTSILLRRVTLIIIIGQPLCPVVGQRRQHVVSKLACLVRCPLPDRIAPVFVQVFSPPLGWSPLSSFLVIWSTSDVTGGPSVVIEAVDMPCPGPFHFFITVLITSVTFVLSLTQMLVFLSLHVMLSILLSILVCAAASLFCAWLVSVQVPAPYVIAGSTQELYTCLFRQMARLLLKISP